MLQGGHSGVPQEEIQPIAQWIESGAPDNRVVKRVNTNRLTGAPGAEGSCEPKTEDVLMSTSIHSRPTLRTVIVVATLGVALFAAAQIAQAYARYNAGCQTCHGNFTASSYASQATGVAWPSSLHQVHRSTSYMSTDCDLCHTSGDGDNPYTYQSNGTGFNVGYGCIGCHGNPTQAGPPSGDGLRQHHVLAGQTVCLDCHTMGAATDQESASPPYYGTVDTLVGSACNSDATTSRTGTTTPWLDNGRHVLRRPPSLSGRIRLPRRVPARQHRHLKPLCPDL
jgi:hypothetical protein